MNTKLQILIQNFPQSQFLIADGFDDAVIGKDFASDRLIYSVKQMVVILCQYGMSWEEAVDYLHFNTLSSYVGQNTPIWCYDLEY